MERDNKYKKINTVQSSGLQKRKLDHSNYCVSGLMSRCSAGTVWEEQHRCKFSEKSSLRHQCMYYIEAIDSHCDCVEAQKELRMRECVRKDKESI
jgi:hypothetical protein